MSTHSNTPNQSNLWLYTNAALALLLIAAGVFMLFWMTDQTSPADGANPVNQIVAQHQGQTAPNFTLPVLSGEAVALSDYEGQVVLINLWATWCPPCKAEMPTLNAFYESHREQGFVVLAVNNKEDAATVNAYIQEKGFTFPVLLDTQAEMLDLYQVQGLPTTFIIDRSGQIQHVQIGEITEEQLNDIVGPLL